MKTKILLKSLELVLIIVALVNMYAFSNSNFWRIFGLLGFFMIGVIVSEYLDFKQKLKDQEFMPREEVIKRIMFGMKVGMEGIKEPYQHKVAAEMIYEVDEVIV